MGGSMAMETVRAALLHPRPLRRGRRDESVDDADAALIRRIAAADRTAMHLLFLRHHLAVYRFALQRLQDKALAEDVTGAIFLDVWRHASRFQGRSTVQAWILAIARHKTFTSARPKSRVRFDGEAAAVPAGSADAPAALSPAEDRIAVLRACMTRLSAEHREVIDLVYYQEQSMESVATILGIPRGAAKTRVFHARKRLADELKKSGVDWIIV
jgi:RNA polymerase sigma-70 factor (ECF subfamily)